MNKNSRISENIDKMAKPSLIWSNSQFNKKTYENLFYKKTFDKYVPIREKLIGDNKKPKNNFGILPDLQSYNNIESKTITTSKNNLRSKSIDKEINPQLQNKNMTLKNNKNNNINSNNIINSTGDTSAFTHSSKKFSSPRAIYTQNYTEDLSNFRMGLLSAGSSCNNNIIIPMMPFRRPVSNFNFGVGQLWNHFENNTTNIKNKENTEDKNKETNLNEEKETNVINVEQKEPNKKEINIDFGNSKRNYNIYNKVNSATRNNKPFKHTEMKKRLELFQSKNDINNLYIGMDKMITKLHKIKILPMMFDSQSVKGNNIDKNKLRSHSFNNRNNFY